MGVIIERAGDVVFDSLFAGFEKVFRTVRAAFNCTGETVARESVESV